MQLLPYAFFGIGRHYVVLHITNKRIDNEVEPSMFFKTYIPTIIFGFIVRVDNRVFSPVPWAIMHCYLESEVHFYKEKQTNKQTKTETVFNHSKRIFRL